MIALLFTFIVHLARAIPVSISVDLGGTKIWSEVRPAGTALVVDKGGAPVWLEDFASGSKLISMTSFQAAGEKYVIVDFFNGYRGTQSMQSCSTVYIYQLKDKKSLVRVDRLIYRCQAAGEAAPVELTFRIRYNVDQKSARLVHDPI